MLMQFGILMINPFLIIFNIVENEKSDFLSTDNTSSNFLNYTHIMVQLIYVTKKFLMSYSLVKTKYEEFIVRLQCHLKSCYIMVKGGNHFQRTLTMSGYFKQIKLICINEVHKYMLSEEYGYQIIYHSFSGLLQQFGYRSYRKKNYSLFY